MSGCSRRLKADQLGSTSPSTRKGIDVNGITLPSRRRCQRWSARPGPRRAGVLIRSAKRMGQPHGDNGTLPVSIARRT